MIKIPTFLLFLVLLVGIGEIQAQKVNVKLDYTITYFIKKSADTIKISIGESGKFLFTDSKGIVDLVKKKFASMPGNINNDSTDVKLLLNTADLEMLFFLNSGKTNFLMNLNLLDFLPQKQVDSESTTTFIAEKMKETIKLMNNNYRLHSIYPNEDPNDKLIFSFDETYSLDYGENLAGLFGLILLSDVSFEIPNGVIIYGEDSKGQEIFRAIKVEKETRTISADLNFYLN